MAGAKALIVLSEGLILVSGWLPNKGAKHRLVVKYSMLFSYFGCDSLHELHAMLWDWKISHIVAHEVRTSGHEVFIAIRTAEHTHD